MKRSKLKIVLFAVGFLLSLTVFLYPTISDAWNRHLVSGLESNYHETLEQIDESGVEAMWKDAEEYNRHLKDTQTLEKLGLFYEELLNPTKDGVMGYLEIPKIRVNLPIRHGLSEGTLVNAVGHMEGTHLPVGGEGTRCVLAGHTGLANARLLSNLDQLRLGDIFQLKILNKTLYYHVAELLVVLPEDVQYIRPVPGEELVTLITCTPYGVNTHRLLVTGIRMEEEEVQRAESLVGNDASMVDPRLIVPLVAVILLVLSGLLRFLYLFYLKQRGKNNEKN